MTLGEKEFKLNMKTMIMGHTTHMPWGACYLLVWTESLSCFHFAVKRNTRVIGT